MKILLVSDVHSNIQALEAVWRREKDSDQVWCAGDLVDYGPFPREVLDWIRHHQAVCVKGNHDQGVINSFFNRDELLSLPRDERRWSQHNAQQLGQSDIEFLQNLPARRELMADGHFYRMLHQGADKYEIINNMVEFDNIWDNAKRTLSNTTGERRIVVGHTHYQAIHYLANRCLWLNPGSLSYRPTRQNLDFSQEAEYMTITDGRIEMKRLNYDRRPLFEAVKKEPMDAKQKATAYRFFAPVGSS